MVVELLMRVKISKSFLGESPQIHHIVEYKVLFIPQLGFRTQSTNFQEPPMSCSYKTVKELFKRIKFHRRIT